MPSKDNLMRFAKSTALVGIAGAASVGVTDYLLDQYTDWCGVKRGAIQAGGHIALGAGIAAMGAPEIGAGVAVGGVVSGTEDVIAYYRADETGRNAMKAAAAARLAAARAARGAAPTATPPVTSQGLPAGNDPVYASFGRQRVAAG